MLHAITRRVSWHGYDFTTRSVLVSAALFLLQLWYHCVLTADGKFSAWCSWNDREKHLVRSFQRGPWRIALDRLMWHQGSGVNLLAKVVLNSRWPHRIQACALWSLPHHCRVVSFLYSWQSTQWPPKGLPRQTLSQRLLSWCFWNFPVWHLGLRPLSDQHRRAQQHGKKAEMPADQKYLRRTTQEPSLSVRRTTMWTWPAPFTVWLVLHLQDLRGSMRHLLWWSSCSSACCGSRRYSCRSLDLDSNSCHPMSSL